MISIGIGRMVMNTQHVMKYIQLFQQRCHGRMHLTDLMCSCDMCIESWMCRVIRPYACRGSHGVGKGPLDRSPIRPRCLEAFSIVIYGTLWYLHSKTYGKSKFQWTYCIMVKRGIIFCVLEPPGCSWSLLGLLSPPGSYGSQMFLKWLFAETPVWNLVLGSYNRSYVCCVPVSYDMDDDIMTEGSIASRWHNEARKDTTDTDACVG